MKIDFLANALKDMGATLEGREDKMEIAYELSRYIIRQVFNNAVSYEDAEKLDRITKAIIDAL